MSGVPEQREPALTRKFVQLVWRENNRAMIALADDGSIWTLEERGVDRGAYFEVTEREWRLSVYPPAPQGALLPPPEKP